jgi:acyl-CoA reductase-like NAD-dependent aldehyde dehydrogenase
MIAEPSRAVTNEERASAQELLGRARKAMAAVAQYDQAAVDRLCRAIAWATANEHTFGRLTRMSVDESGMGSADGVPARRWKILGILRDALRTRSVGVIEELPDKGIVKYAKPVGVIAGLLPVTNPLVTMVNMTINALKCRDAVVFSPHPLSRKTALEIARVLRAALKRAGAPEDLVLLWQPGASRWAGLMSICDLTIATGDRDGQGARTARANRPTASAPAMRRLSSTRLPIWPTRREIPGSAKHRITGPAARATATCWSRPRCTTGSSMPCSRKAAISPLERKKRD